MNNKYTESDLKLGNKLRSFLEENLSNFPWEITIKDWCGNCYSIGKKKSHWGGKSLNVHLKSKTAGKNLLTLNGMHFLERFLEGEVDLEGNLYLMDNLRNYIQLSRLKFWQLVPYIIFNSVFQNLSRARVNVKSHYDIPQKVLNVYLDKVYLSYSCGMFENPENITMQDILTPGKGKNDSFDSLEKAQWRKFKDAVDFINPEKGDTLLDVGCGYGGQLKVAMENYPFGKVVGWTHSRNQVREGRKMLSKFPKDKWKLHEGDYRENNQVFDHITSTGMISHVGPRGLIPYVKNIRKRIKTGGRYLHHALMVPSSKIPNSFEVGSTFNKKYVWPGFHWFTIGDHIRALENNNFEVQRLTNLSKHYAKTTASWYERMMVNKEMMVKQMGEPTFRAWQIFLAGITSAYLNKKVHVYRVYCEAI